MDAGQVQRSDGRCVSLGCGGKRSTPGVSGSSTPKLKASLSSLQAQHRGTPSVSRLPKGPAPTAAPACRTARAPPGDSQHPHYPADATVGLSHLMGDPGHCGLGMWVGVSPGGQESRGPLCWAERSLRPYCVLSLPWAHRRPRRTRKYSSCSQDLTEGLPESMGTVWGPLLYRNEYPWAQIPPAPSEELPVPSLASFPVAPSPRPSPPWPPQQALVPGPCFLEGASPSPQKMLLKWLPTPAPSWGSSIQIQVSSPEDPGAVSRAMVSDGWGTVCGVVRANGHWASMGRIGSQGLLGLRPSRAGVENERTHLFPGLGTRHWGMLEQWKRPISADINMMPASVSHSNRLGSPFSPVYYPIVFHCTWMYENITLCLTNKSFWIFGLFLLFGCS